MSHEHIVEDSPTMRSVAIAAPPLMPSMRPLTTKTTTPLKVSAAAPSLKTTDICNSFPELPVGYFLERTHVRIHDATPEQVMSRVESILARESVATHYDKNEAQIACETFDHVEFYVRFFQTPESILVEMQRCCGCSFGFHQLAKSILRGAKGLPCPVSKPLPTLLQCIPRATEQEQLACAQEGIDIAVSLLKQGTLDAQCMALESLAHIAKIAAEPILGNPEIRSVLLSSCIETNSDCKLHRAAITVVANCLGSLQANGTLESCLKEHRDALLCDRLLTQLLGEIAHCDQKPHEACQAIRCLQVLCCQASSTETRQRMKEAEVLVSRAVEDGHRHALLGDVSQQFLRTHGGTNLL